MLGNWVRGGPPWGIRGVGRKVAGSPGSAARGWAPLGDQGCGPEGAGSLGQYKSNLCCLKVEGFKG